MTILDRMLGALLAGAITVGALGGPIEDARTERLMGEARASESRQDWQAAERAYRTVLASQPDHRLAAMALRSLHEDGRAEVSQDEPTVEETERLLGAGFYRVETPWFVVLSDCDEVWTAARAGVLERAARQFRRSMETMGLEWVPPETKLVCVLFAEHGDFVAFAQEHDGVRANWVSGYYATGSNRVAFFDETTAPSVVRSVARIEEARRDADTDARRALAKAERDLETHAREASIAKTVHEAVHQLAFNCNFQRRSRSYPFWFTEGFAGSFETGEPRHNFGPSVEQEKTDADVASAHGEGRLLALRELVSVTDPSSVGAERASVMYAQSNSLFRYLYRFQREEMASYARALWDAPPRELSGEEHAELFARHFGNPDSLERKWIKRAVER